MCYSPISQLRLSSTKITDETPALPSPTGTTTKRAPRFLLFPHGASPTTTCEVPHRATSIRLLLFFSLVPTENFGKTTTVKSHLASTSQENHHLSSEEIDNNDN
ncbi:hypothetical protein H5410_016346 [Solanum commersonii]|uniref:Uncharacterized protein n=1 Tax=Solanum commersonii TaxID=4109 RepID=A0A9J5ZX49_SOLCO|nr:hypothetical protein H5410_016346 [Solanum commersonii]